jgi:hypothetical protein
MHCCHVSYVESSKRRDLSSLIWPRFSGEGAAEEGAEGEEAEGEEAEGEEAEGEGAQGEGAQGEGAQGEGAQGESPSNPLPGDPSEIPPSPPGTFLVGSDESLPDRSPDNISVAMAPSDANQEILPMGTYEAKVKRSTTK